MGVGQGAPMYPIYAIKSWLIICHASLKRKNHYFYSRLGADDAVGF
jgi:hypothetical protein